MGENPIRGGGLASGGFETDVEGRFVHMAKLSSEQKKVNNADKFGNGHSFAMQLANFDPTLLDEPANAGQ